ncbi:F510_1955 family glycosylhydrolase [Streptosporangium canum]|uniref:F510_1955 family glycosylhydrolase n=1 Tax=Streptosporangium canum TaxID=324952 RepID=UPI0036C086BA
MRLGAAAAVLVLVLTACGQAEHPAAQSPGGADDPGIGHVHGLGIDPADGALYVAGHFGLFRVKSAESAERVAGRIQDHMGFTVIGPRTFLASGHPGDPDAASPHLGLIRTTDAGVTWTTVSEEGAADFHALQQAGEVLYAYDSQTGRVRSSGDQGRTWKQGAFMEVIDLAAGAGEPARVYATTPGGLHVSEDGGMAFAPVKGIPLLSHVDAPGEELLVGPDADGQIQISRDRGRTWSVAGRLPGPATVFTAVDAQRMLASLEDGTVLESRNGGKDFAVAFRPATG